PLPSSPHCAPTITVAGMCRVCQTRRLGSGAMSTPVALLLLVGALALTVTSSVVLARELDRIGERLGFSEALLGIVTAVGADAPEIASAVAAVVAGHEDTGVGVVVGSNVFNLAALLGVSALISGPVRIHKHGLWLNGGVAVVVAAVGLRGATSSAGRRRAWTRLPSPPRWQPWSAAPTGWSPQLSPSEGAGTSPTSSSARSSSRR